MNTVTMDFKNDWMEFLVKELTEMGFKYDVQKSLKDNTVAYFNVKRRVISRKPRVVHESKELCVPSEYVEAYRAIRDLISRGEDLRPYLSRKTKDLHDNDLLLNEWGIHHLHFSPERTKDVLFVRFTDTDAFVIQVFPHGRGHEEAWVNTSLIEILHKNWPTSIVGRRVTGGSGEDITTKERLNVRKAHGNVAVNVPDGTCYTALGGGVMTSGICFSDISNLRQAFGRLGLLGEIGKSK
jgi:hypothetical protein